MKGVRSFRTRLKKDSKSEGFQKAFEEEAIFTDIAIQIAKIREERHLNQKDLAKMLHTSQQMVSRLENTHNQSFSLKTLIKLARAFHKKLSVQFI